MVVCGALLSGAATAELAARLKGFGVATALPDDDLTRELEGTPRYSASADLRLLWKLDRGRWHVGVDHESLLLLGDDIAALTQGPRSLEQRVIDDERRLVDASWTLDQGGRHQLAHRFDRFWVRHQGERLSVTLGRQAVSWGGGIVFAPLDLFNPFSPTVVDRDYKQGDDLLLVEALLPSGADLQLLAVGRRDAQGDAAADVASFAAKWHGFAGSSELELFAARHFDEPTYGLGLRHPVGSALARADLLLARSDAAGWTVAAVVNLDYSLVAWGRNLYLFGEAFYNGFGVNRLPDDPAELPEALQARLGRGELFTLMRRYVAAGVDLEWHPLWHQRLSLVGNLHDGSVLASSSLSFDASDNQRFEFGVIAALGGSGDEYGGVPVATDPQTGARLTTGGGVRGYLRWVGYF